jgi:hypothetical protein
MECQEWKPNKKGRQALTFTVKAKPFFGDGASKELNFGGSASVRNIFIISSKTDIPQRAPMLICNTEANSLNCVRCKNNSKKLKETTSSFPFTHPSTGPDKKDEKQQSYGIHIFPQVTVTKIKHKTWEVLYLERDNKLVICQDADGGEQTIPFDVG